MASGPDKPGAVQHRQMDWCPGSETRRHTRGTCVRTLVNQNGLSNLTDGPDAVRTDIVTVEVPAGTPRPAADRQSVEKDCGVSTGAVGE